MASDTKRITVRIPTDLSDGLEKLVDQGEFSNVSDAIRTAITKLIEDKDSPEHISKVTVDLPKKNVDDIESLISEGDSINVDDAIRTAVREYIKDRIKQYKEQKIQM
ncbi:MAG: ribbon-helix-helix protein, CopG family [Thermoplasmata archaeon]